MSLKIFDIVGREIESLVNEDQDPGAYHIRYDRHNLSSGIYFIRLQADGFVDVKKCVLMR